MAEKHKEKINPDAIRELISQGIPMRRKDSSPSASCEEKESVEETQEEERTFRGGETASFPYTSQNTEGGL